MTLKGKDMLSMRHITREEITQIFEVADRMTPKEASEDLKGKILATLFFQPSTRTRLSFESAMHRLGGAVLGFADPSVSRAGDPRFSESLEDTVRVIDDYSDIIVIRHFIEGAPALAAKFSEVPVINAGDGRGEHPTQALLDLYTIRKEKGKIDNLKIAITGNLQNSRVMHATALAMAKFKVHLFLMSPENLRMPDAILEELRKGSASFEEVLLKPPNLERIIREADVMSVVTSIPDRLENIPLTIRLEMLPFLTYYRIDLEKLANAKEGFMILHSLPRSDQLGYQISPSVDETSYAKYFEQSANGVRVRMAILGLLLGAFE